MIFWSQYYIAWFRQTEVPNVEQNNNKKKNNNNSSNNNIGINIHNNV